MQTAATRPPNVRTALRRSSDKHRPGFNPLRPVSSTKLCANRGRPGIVTRLETAVGLAAANKYARRGYDASSVSPCAAPSARLCVRPHFPRNLPPTMSPVPLDRQRVMLPPAFGRQRPWTESLFDPTPAQGPPPLFLFCFYTIFVCVVLGFFFFFVQILFAFANAIHGSDEPEYPPRPYTPDIDPPPPYRDEEEEAADRRRDEEQRRRYDDIMRAVDEINAQMLSSPPPPPPPAEDLDDPEAVKSPTETPQLVDVRVDPDRER
ncbi:hypothetical protein MKEN_00280800 [Mycena kentingensis (nom. inval.)]|nr:hypothetical protein MKEN_00280500 [Mycena kentingensis (nom. inval.)]KAF7327056.1 hypothetical protein MKEN_00280800 [Mycena kentingensis (nom. inval.)]